MRLLKVDGRDGLSFTPNLIENIPAYAILSHTWGSDDDEVDLDDIKNKSGPNKAGYAKIKCCAEQARKDGYSYIWVDTCCIDQKNQAELSEAIVSMYRWYQHASKCYVYLADVGTRKRDSQGEGKDQSVTFIKSRWFTRGWTLQELLAPTRVEFYSREWKYLGDKDTLQQDVHRATQIPLSAIRSFQPSDIAPEEKMRWTAKRDTKRPEDRWYCLQGIFDVCMNPMYGEGERNAFIRLKDEIGKFQLRALDAIEQHCSHDPKRFQEDEGRSVSVTNNILSIQEIRKQLLTSMSFDQMDSRRSTIKNAYATTCMWLLQHTAYLEWIDPDKFHQHYGFLWIKGKPGAGKSTLVKFIHADAHKSKKEDEIVISFFFNARGDELEKSTIGMYRALLVQLFNEVPDLQKILDGYQKAFHQGGEHPMWSIEMLSELFSSAVIKLGRRQLKCFIDALDECDEDQIRQMIDHLEDLGQKAFEAGIKIHICFASRHYPAIEIQNGQQLTLEKEDGHAKDLAKYIHKHLKVGARRDKDVEKIRLQILEKANGVFMWAVLVIPLLNKEFQAGRQFAVKKRLEEVPLELSSLFKHILIRDKDNLEDLLLCLQWTLYAKRPLKREEFYFAMLAGLDPGSDSMGEWDPEDITDDVMNRFVLSSSKGLAELTRSKIPTVQFIHESVRDFLIKDGGLCELWPELKTNLHSLSHDRLKRCCLEYLALGKFDDALLNISLPKAKSDTTRQIREMWAARLPFLEYASRHILQHADEAARGVSQDRFLADFPVWRWIKIRNLFERHDTCRHTPNVSLVYILAEDNLARLITVACRSGSNLHSSQAKGERHRYPILAALANTHREAVQTLLSLASAQVPEDVFASFNFSRTFTAERGLTVLRWALWDDHKLLFNALLNAVFDPFYPADSGNRAHVRAGVFLLACERAYTDLVLHILVIIGQTSRFDDMIFNGLESAVQSGHEDVVTLLLEKVPEFQPGSHLTFNGPLSIASEKGHERILELLIGAGIHNIFVMDAKRALEIASRSGFARGVEIILKAEAYIAPSRYDHLLYEAMAHGHDEVVQIIRDAALRVATQDGYDRALAAAVRDGHDRILRILLDAGIGNITQKGYDDALATVLLYCPASLERVRLLLDAGANIYAQNIYGESIYHFASRRKQQTGAQLILAAGITISEHKHDMLSATSMGIHDEAAQTKSDSTAPSQGQQWRPTISNLLN